jgi:ferrochelatase
MTVGRYAEQLEEARAGRGADIPVSVVRSWNRQPALVAALAERILAALERFPAADRDAVPVLYTAHSLPERILATGDPYPDEVRGTIEAVAARLAEARGGRPLAATFAYQSQGRSTEPWLGPTVESVLDDLAGEGCRGVVVAPIGFLSDHVEVNYDVDIEFRARAEQLGMRLERMEMPNDADRLVEALAAVVAAELAAEAA